MFEDTHARSHALNGRELIVAAVPCFFFFFSSTNLSHSVREASGCPPSLPGGSLIYVMGGCGGLHHVPVNSNHIKLSRPLTEGMSALWPTFPSIEPEFVFESRREVFMKRKGSKK